MISEKKVSLLPTDMPDGKALLAEGRKAGEEFEMGISLLCEEHGVRSEPEYRRKMLKEGRLMTAMNIGLQTWQDTAEALRIIHEETKRRGFRIDRYQMQLDRRMGLPPELWGRAAKETGPMLVTDEDWLGTTRTVPIQPHLGDMMIGSPMSLINAQKALKAGVNYIGNMGQFAWKYPAWQGDDVAQMSEMVKGLGLMASKADQGATVQSYLDDGYGAQFQDYCSYIGWALFERYIVNKVIDARLSISFGGLTRNPVMKMAMIMALESIKPEDTITAFYGCNTTAFTTDIQRNYAVLAIDVLYLMRAQLRTQSATAVIPIPVTEAVRVPSWQEIVEVHTIARRIAEDAERLMETIDWPSIEKISDRMLEGGRLFYDNIMKGLSEFGVVMEDPLQFLLSVRRLGAVEIESRFGVGEHPKDESESYRPVIPTDTLQDFINQKSVCCW